MDRKKKAVIIAAALELLDDSDSEIYCLVTQRQKKRKLIAIERYIEKVAFRYQSEGERSNIYCTFLSEKPFLDFRRHFRLRRDTFEHLLEILSSSLIHQNTRGVGRHTHSPETQLLVALCMLANQEVYR